MRRTSFDEVGPVWRGKETNGEVETIFQSHGWNQAWWGVFAAGKDLLLWSAGHPGREAVLPLYRTRRRVFGVLPFAEVMFLGTGESVGTDFVDVVSGRDEESTDLFVRWEKAMRESGEDWDLLNLLEVRPDSRALRMCLEWHKATGNPILVLPRYPCPYLDLPPTMQEYRENVISRSVRRAISNKWNRLRRDFQLEIKFTSDGCDAKTLFDEFVSLHEARWEGKGKFSDPLYLEFHRRMLRQAEERKWLFIANMYLDGKPSASQYGYIFGERYYYWQAGRIPGLDRYSPGLVLFYRIIEELCSRNVKGIELLRGSHAYKLHFASGTVHTLQIRVYNRTSWRARALYAKDTLKALVRRLQPEEHGSSDSAA